MLCANSLIAGYFPKDWTVSHVKLLPKSGDLSNAGNWRPISLTNIFSKLLEKIVHTQLLKYLLDNELLSKKQFGFVPGRSTHEAIFKTVHSIYGSINSRKIMGMLLLDVAKAFNCIDHEILYVKMERAGFGPNVVNWFRSYLDRTQITCINEMSSTAIRVPYGIAQGTVLGPILFIFYINDIFKCTRYVNMSLFADDCVMFLSGNNWDIIQRRIQSDFDAVIDWTLHNSLRLNQAKTKAMIFSTRSRLTSLNDPTPFRYFRERIAFVKNHIYLGVTLDNSMSLIPLLKNIKKRVSNKIFHLRKLRKYMTFDASVLVYKQTILPIIDYAGFLLLSLSKGDLDELQVLQNDILRVCNNTRISDKVSIEELHKKCKLLSLKQRMEKQLLGLMYMLSRDISYHHVPNRNTRRADKTTFKLPSKISPIYERSPYNKGCKMWDSLEMEIQSRENVFAFKKEIARMYKSYNKN